MLTVTVSEFRNNLSEYLELIRRNKKVSITDGRKGKVLVTLRREKKDRLDRDEYLRFVRSLAGSGFLAGKEDEAVRRRFRKDINKRFSEARERK